MVSFSLNLGLRIGVLSPDAVWCRVACQSDGDGVLVYTIVSPENPSYADVSKRTFIHNNVVARIYRSPAAMPEWNARSAIPLQLINCPVILVGKDEYR